MAKDIKKPTSIGSHAFSLGNFPQTYYDKEPLSVNRISTRKQPPLPGEGQGGDDLLVQSGSESEGEAPNPGFEKVQFKAEDESAANVADRPSTTSSAYQDISHQI